MARNKNRKVKVPARLREQRFFLGKDVDSYVHLDSRNLKLADCDRRINWYIPSDPKEAEAKFGRFIDLLNELRALWREQDEAGEETSY